MGALPPSTMPRVLGCMFRSDWSRKIYGWRFGSGARARVFGGARARVFWLGRVVGRVQLVAQLLGVARLFNWLERRGLVALGLGVFGVFFARSFFFGIGARFFFGSMRPETPRDFFLVVGRF